VIATAAVWSGAEFTLTEIPVPSLGPGEVLVEVELATICGSDLHTVAGHRDTPVPTILGHEAVGRVVCAGRGVEVAVGQRVVWSVGTSCGTCRRCVRGAPQKCATVRKYGHERLDDAWNLNGALASHVHVVAGTTVVPVPEHLPAALLAPAGCATATVIGAARRVGLVAHDAVAILGCGMLGLTAVAYARDRGATSIVACDPDAARRRAALRLGADVACAPVDLRTVVADRGADVVFEMSGHPSSVAAALDIVDIDGRVGLIGSVSPGPSVSIDPNLLVRRLTRIVGSHNYAPVDLVEAVAFLGRTPVREQLANLVGPPTRLRAVELAFRSAQTGLHPRVAVDPAGA